MGISAAHDRHGYPVMKCLASLEVEMVLRAMAFIEAGEWPWQSDMDGTPPATEARERAAWKRAKAKLENVK
jgi:hypothetical protein